MLQILSKTLKSLDWTLIIGVFGTRVINSSEIEIIYLTEISGSLNAFRRPIQTKIIKSALFYVAARFLRNRGSWSYFATNIKLHNSKTKQNKKKKNETPNVSPKNFQFHLPIFFVIFCKSTHLIYHSNRRYQTRLFTRVR